MADAAKIILVNKKKQLLLVLRDNKPEIPYPHYWAEIGGAIEKNETPLEALKREIKEDISCKINNILSIGEFFNPEFKATVKVFRGNFNEDLKNIKLYEGEKLGLFEFDELKNLRIPPPLREFLLSHKKEILD